MDRWREKADELFPELTSRLDADDAPYSLWFELPEAFEEADDKTPPDESLIKRIYRYSNWCCERPRRETDLDDGPDGRPNIFRHHLAPEQFEELRQFLVREKDRYDSDPW